jgi:peptidoglycan/LPS O-acetylase OafA/YrhL
MTTAPQSREFFRALESLRGIAALGVVLLHIAFAWTFPLYDLGFIRNGYLMVDLFFVLSGFVICHRYGSRIETGRDAAQFVWVRFGRLYPLHLIFLFVFLGFEVAKYIGETQYGLIAHSKAFTSNNTFSFMSNLLLIQGLGVHDKDTYNLPAWSISTEFYVYIIFAAILLLFKARVAMVSASGLLIFASITLDSGKLDHNIFRCVEGFFVGVITYHCYVALSTRQLPELERRWYKHLPGILSCAGLIVFLSMKNGNGFDALILPLVGLLILSITVTPKGLLSTILEVAPLVWVGKVSYSIYMVHMAVIWSFSQVLRLGLKTPRVIDGNGDPLLAPHPLAGFLFLTAAIACILFISHVTYIYIEDPYRRKSRKLAEKWFPASAANCAGKMEPGMRTDLSSFSTPETLNLEQRRS